MNLSKVITGVYVCHCGTNIAGKVDVAAVAEFARHLETVVLARDYTYMSEWVVPFQHRCLPTRSTSPVRWETPRDGVTGKEKRT